MKLFTKKVTSDQNINLTSLLPLLYIAGRLLLFLALIPNNLHGFGDFQIYFDSAALPGLPYFQSWSEYPPIFAWTVEIVYLVAQGNQFLFDFLFYFILSIAGAVSIWLVAEICKLLGYDDDQINLRSGIFFAFLAFSSYTWWYFDLVPVAFMLASIYYLLKGNDIKSGVWLGIGILAKWFPILLLPAVFRFKKIRPFLKTTLIAIGIPIIVWGIHLALSPTMTWASLKSQPSRSSWETVWALIDGNMTTGAFVPIASHLNPDSVGLTFGNLARIPSIITLLLFCGIGIFMLFKVQNFGNHSFLAFIGITWIIFLNWSPGWSPQWVLYLLPLIFLTFTNQKCFLFNFLLILLALLEWPTFLGHFFSQALWFLVPMRILLFIGIFMQWLKIIRIPDNFDKSTSKA